MTRYGPYVPSMFISFLYMFRPTMCPPSGETAVYVWMPGWKVAGFGLLHQCRFNVNFWKQL